jgi:RhtB (resistance to homoserine/threonine) family protein
MFAQVFLVGLLGAISPGPDFVVVTRNSLVFGRGVGMATAAGIATGLTIHVLYTVLGFAVILQQRPDLFRWIQLLGAAYLAWLGWNAVRSGPSHASLETGPSATQARTIPAGYRDGLLCNALNPKVALFFLSIFSQFLTPGTPGWVQLVYGLEVVLAAGLWFVVLSIVISSAAFRLAFQKQRHWFDRLLGAVLLYFAARILWSVAAGR